MTHRRFLLIFAVFVLGMLGVLSVVLRERVTYIGKAGGGEAYALENSYLFGSPLSASAGGEEKIRIFAFLLNSQGRGVPDKKVEVKSDPFLTIVPVQEVTDKLGQAIFEVTSSTPGRFSVSAAVEGRLFPQSLTLTFR